MSTINFKGQPMHISGTLPAPGSHAPDFCLTKTDLSEFSSKDLSGQRLVLNIFPSLDTPVCAASVRKFNETASQLPEAQVLCISMDLPFAQQRFCASEGLKQVVPLSAFRHSEFGQAYGVSILDGALKGLLARAIVIIATEGKVIYTELVPEITDEPNYALALAQLTR